MFVIIEICVAQYRTSRLERCPVVQLLRLTRLNVHDEKKGRIGTRRELLDLLSTTSPARRREQRHTTDY